MSPLSLMDGPEHDQGPGVDELGEGLLDVEGGAGRQAVGVARHQLDGAVEASRGGHLVDADAHGVFEQRPVVGLGEVVEHTHQDRCRGACGGSDMGPLRSTVSG